MSNYTNTFGGAAKDAANDIILGAAHDTEYDAVVVAVTTKADKIVSGTTDNIMTMDSGGDLKNSGKLITDKADVAGDTYTGVIDQDDATDSTTGGTGSIHTDGGMGAVKEIVTDATFKPIGDTASGDLAAFGHTTVDGAILTGQGSTNDVVLKNDADAIALRVPTGTQNIVVPGTAEVTGAQTLTGVTTHGDDVVSDTDGTDDLGTTSTRWRELFVDDITATTDITAGGSLISIGVAVAPNIGSIKGKTADEVFSNTTYADDTHLKAWTLLAATIYKIEGYLSVVSGGSNSDFKGKFQLDNAAQASAWTIDGSGEVNTHKTNITTEITVQTTTTRSSISITGYVQTHATLASVLDFQWAQNVDNLTTTLKLGSWITLTAM